MVSCYLFFFFLLQKCLGAAVSKIPERVEPGSLLSVLANNWKSVALFEPFGVLSALDALCAAFSSLCLQVCRIFHLRCFFSLGGILDLMLSPFQPKPFYESVI